MWSHLSPPESQTLYEVCYYSSSATVRRHLNAAPRTSIQAALNSPFYYLQAFATVVSAAEGNDPDSDSFGKVDDVKHARFIRAVSELEFLGFIKSTKQKTDHVARITWGGC
ncbi:hypothetical protein F7725_008098 [Dissostichus mawsoni]|uniref:Origin recognition complex subunit 3 winged helix C-terminal domain-containing protein n=1 Tax=Dissostichus mawsoni TaxID=36200 RepID=A0A7J5Y676_DISMA|nr:hypothetical protein F7725_008098 [Dissostichus mawsoni]